MRRFVLLVVRLPVGVPPPAGGCFCLSDGKVAEVRRKALQLELVASDDLADARAVQADKLAYVAEREAVLLGLGKGLAPRRPSGVAVALELLLRCFDRFGGGFALSVVRHRRHLNSPTTAGTLLSMTAKEKLLREVLDLDEAQAARARIVIPDEPVDEPEMAPLPAGWGETLTGEPMPNVAAA